MPETLLTVEQAAQRLQLHQITVRRQIARGQLRAIRKGRSVRIPESALVEDSPSPETPQVQANTILNAFKSGDFQARNAAIVALSQAAVQTRVLVLAAVESETAGLADDDLADWRALDGEPFREDAA